MGGVGIRRVGVVGIRRVGDLSEVFVQVERSISVNT